MKQAVHRVFTELGKFFWKVRVDRLQKPFQFKRLVEVYSEVRSTIGCPWLKDLLVGRAGNKGTVAKREKGVVECFVRIQSGSEGPVSRRHYVAGDPSFIAYERDIHQLARKDVFPDLLAVAGGRCRLFTRCVAIRCLHISFFTK